MLRENKMDSGLVDIIIHIIKVVFIDFPTCSDMLPLSGMFLPGDLWRTIRSIVMMQSSKIGLIETRIIR